MAFDERQAYDPAAAKDPRQRFGATAEDYSLHRPTYPAELLAWIFAAPGLPSPAEVADVGCGTGISTRLLAAAGHLVVGIDPNEEMLAHARAAGGPVRYQQGEAAATGLPERSVDLVTVGQAFHWFDVPAALAEFRRVLRPGGWCAAFWNVRDKSPLLLEYEEVLQRYSTEYESRPRPADALARIRACSDVVSLREATFRVVQLLGREGLRGRAHSSSYVAHGVPDHAALDRELDGLFDRHQQGDRVEFLYRTLAAAWQLGPV